MCLLVNENIPLASVSALREAGIRDQAVTQIVHAEKRTIIASFPIRLPSGSESAEIGRRAS